MEPENDIEVRRFSDFRLVHRGATRDPMLRGYAIVFNSLSEDLGGFREVIKPEAVDRTFQEKIDVRALVDHDPSKVLARLTAGTLRLKPDKHGLGVEIDIPNTSYGRDLVESVGRRDLREMSFAFRVMMPDGVRWIFDEEPPIREVLDMRTREVSVVTFAAYPATDVEVAQRSLRALKETHTYRPGLALLENRQRQAGA